ncbi:MAG TPA: hypothetical protein VJ672_14385 [Gemmatimonadaceae bacterium]|nr:hypothetical protein [Gemmatimonadaceae bacterium]
MRFRRIAEVTASMLLLAGATRSAVAQAASQSGNATALIRRAITAVGGEGALRAIDGTTSTMWLSRFNLGGGQWPGAPGTLLQIAGTEARDFRGERVAIRGKRFTIAGDTQQVRIVATPDGGFERIFTYTLPYTTDTLAQRRRELHLTPARLLLTASRARCRTGPTITRETSGRRLRSVTCSTAETGEFIVRLDSAWGWPMEVERVEEGPMFGAQRVLSRYGSFTPVETARGRALLPYVVHQFRDGRLESVTAYSRIEASLPNDSVFAVPDSLRSETFAKRPIDVRVEELAPGVHYLSSGADYNALAVIQRDSIILLEAAETQDRLRAMIDTLARRFPQSPVRMLVSSHHHADHMAGIPLAFARGIDVATHPDNLGWIRRMAALASQRTPRAARASRVVAVSDSLVLGRGTATELRLYPIALSEAATHVMGVLPQHGILYIADTAEGDIAPDLRAEVERRGLRIRRAASAHSGMTDWSKSAATP